MIMQAYDFLTLNRDYGCVMQLGGDDQWSNMLAGVELIRRKEHKPAYCMTCKLLTTSEGVKMGLKPWAVALWLDPEKTTPYDFYQYWRNVNDADVENCLALLTFLPMEEVRRLGSLEGSEINKAKVVLAYEVTKLIHGEEEALKAKTAAEALFGDGSNMEDVPTINVGSNAIGTKLIDILASNGIFASKSEGRRLVVQGGLYLDDTKISDVEAELTADMFNADKSILIRKGKKKYYRLILA